MAGPQHGAPASARTRATQVSGSESCVMRNFHRVSIRDFGVVCYGIYITNCDSIICCRLEVGKLLFFFFLVKGQVVKSLGFTGHILSFELFNSGVKVVLDHM